MDSMTHRRKMIQEQQAKARKEYARKNFWDNILAGFAVIGTVLAGLIGILAIFALIFAIPIIGVVLTVISLTTLITTGFNVWAVVGLVVGVFFVSRVKFTREDKVS